MAHGIFDLLEMCDFSCLYGFLFTFKVTLIRAINNHPGVLVTTYAGVRLNKKELYRYYWEYVILDEGHKIRNPDSEVTLACKQVYIFVFEYILYFFKCFCFFVYKTTN